MAANEDPSCLFCKIVKGTIPCHKVYETEHCLAFLDIMPVAEGHTQVIPKYHAVTLGDLPDEYLRDIGPVVKKIALATGVEQYNIVQNNGKMAFQHVPHVHFHVIPKPNEQEGLVISLENWPQKKPDNEVLAVTCAKMKERL
ncbi:HIT-like domain-containing protein [Mycena haematopus]|nr:HIT-like domain-containing protein [Mycena haematopus]KAJ7244709.1 HIT-like domain-containing protein [Mycena haematopus]KAJ7264553.1 HIT-like domain-containing protein [Mycena haematopus]